MSRRKRGLQELDYSGCQVRPCPRKTLAFSNWFALQARRRTMPSGVWSVRRASRLFRPSLVVHVGAYIAGIFLVTWGFYAGGTTLTTRGGADEILNNLLWIFFGFFLIFLANHEKAVAKKLKM